MKETPVSVNEKTFIQRCIEEKRRLDGRRVNEFRPLKINFGADWGCVHVSLGETRAMAQVSCDLGQPKATRPNEGMLFINVELSSMAAAHFESGRSSDLSVQINRILERTLKDSRCIDLESLCVTAEDKVWVLRCDVTILNHEGNLIDCASVAALCALAHFKRPDVSITGEEIKVHTSAEKDPIPLALHHYPVCISYATFQDGEVAIADPTAIEERCAEANMIFGLNSFRELCCINLGGTTHTSTDLLLQCSSRAANRAKLVVDQIKEVLEQDEQARSQGKTVGFTECLRLEKITSLAEDKLTLKLPKFSFSNPYQPVYATAATKEEAEDTDVTKVEEGTIILSSNQANIKWVDEDSDEHMDEFNPDDNEDDDESDLEHELEDAKLQQHQRQSQPISKVAAPAERAGSDTSSDSEEESTMILG